jgi:hypothetical protein
MDALDRSGSGEKKVARVPSATSAADFVRPKSSRNRLIGLNRQDRLDRSVAHVDASFLPEAHDEA